MATFKGVRSCRRAVARPRQARPRRRRGGVRSLTLIALISWLAFGEKLDPPAVLGMSLIVAGVVVLNLFSKTGSHCRGTGLPFAPAARERSGLCQRTGRSHPRSGMLEPPIPSPRDTAIPGAPRLLKWRCFIVDAYSKRST